MWWVVLGLGVGNERENRLKEISKGMDFTIMDTFFKLPHLRKHIPTN